MAYKVLKTYMRKDLLGNHVEVSFMSGDSGKIEWIRVCTLINGLKLRSDFYKNEDSEFETVFQREALELVKAESEPRQDCTDEIFRMGNNGTKEQT